MTLATFLRQQGFPNVGCLDANAERMTPQETARVVAQTKPDLVGITAWTDFWYPVTETIKEIKALLPKTAIVLGGPHCFIYPSESLEYSAADYLIAGDGEEPLLHLVKSLETGQPTGDFPGLWKKENGRAIAPSVPIASISDPSIIPSPDRTLLDIKRYSSVIGMGNYETTMITSRGCPHKCVFCKVHSQQISVRPAHSIISEFKEIRELGIRDIQVYDDTFTWSKRRVKEICQGIIDAKLDVRWAIRDRVNQADPEMYKLLREAGCYRIHFGVESGSPQILKDCGKAITLDQAIKAVQYAKDARIETMAFFMFGFLDEVRADAEKTIRFATKLDPDYAVFLALIPYPGTTLYEVALERGIIPNDFWLEFVKNPTPNFYIPSLVEQNFTRDEIVQFKNRAQRRFYWRPKVILRELRKTKSLGGLISRASMGIRILFEGLGK
jgi:radical SAM superfamily enzyme YgiQ (UPF0313 family)